MNETSQETIQRRAGWVMWAFAAVAAAVLLLTALELWLLFDDTTPADEVTELLELCEQEREVEWSIRFDDLAVTVSCPSEAQLAPGP